MAKVIRNLLQCRASQPALWSKLKRSLVLASQGASCLPIYTFSLRSSTFAPPITSCSELQVPFAEDICPDFSPNTRSGARKEQLHLTIILPVHI